MTTELLVLLLGTALGLVHIGLQSMSITKERGTAWNVGPRDDQQPATGLAGRLERANNNFKETFPFFVAVVLVGAVTQRFSSVTSTAAIVWLAARVIYIPLYAFGVPYLRSLIWITSLAAIVAIGGAVGLG